MGHPTKFVVLDSNPANTQSALDAAPIQPSNSHISVGKQANMQKRAGVKPLTNKERVAGGHTMCGLYVWVVVVVGG